MDKEIRTFELENQAQANGAIEAIKENFSKEQNEQAQIIVKFIDDINKDEFLQILQQLFQYEIDSGFVIDILIKNLPYEYRKEALGLALRTPELRNPIFLMNVFCLIKGYNTFEESYFQHEQVFLNDEVEFLDIFDDLEKEIKEVTNKTAEYYVSMLKTCNLVEAVENNPNAVTMENIYVYLFDCMDVTILAKILSSVKDSSIWETKKIVMNSLEFLANIAEKFVFANSVMNIIGREIMERSVKASLDAKVEE